MSPSNMLHSMIFDDYSEVFQKHMKRMMVQGPFRKGSYRFENMSSYAGLPQAVSRMSLPWQGNVARHLKTLHLNRLLYGKVTGLLPYRASGGSHRDLGNGRERQWIRCEASEMDASVLSLDAFPDDKNLEVILNKEEKEPDSDLTKSLAAKDTHLQTCTSDFELKRPQDIGNETLGMPLTEQYLTENVTSSGPGAQEVPLLNSSSGAETRDMKGTTLKDLTKGAEYHAQSFGQAASIPTSVGHKPLELKRTKHFWKILENDISIMRNAVKEFQETVLPFLTADVQNMIALRWWEDPSAPRASATPTLQPYETGLSGLDLIATDFMVVKSYLNAALVWIRAWQIPLESWYEPGLIAGYFNRRPHILLFRILQVSAVFGVAIFQLELEKLLKPAEMNSENGLYAQRRGAELFKESLVTLGPAFVKVGQSLSTRPDLIGTTTCQVLARLQDNLPPFSTTQAVSIIEEELGGPIDTIFSDLSELPVAAASFGQVYKGRTIHGQDVAVKVQRPNLLHSVALDIYILRMGLAVLRKIAKRKSDLKLYADELGYGFFGELDYIKEADNAMEFQEAHSKVKFLEVPKIIRGLSTRRVLTMEWIEGDRPVDMLIVAEMPIPDGNVLLREQQLKAKQRLYSLVNKGVEASLVQLFDTGILHADPHPGNLLYTEDGQMVFLDFGLICRVEKRHQLAMMASVAHIVNADWDSFVQDLADMEVLPAYVDRRAVALELVEALADVVPEEGVPNIKFSKVLVNVLGIALKHQFRMPPYFILILRSIASLEGLALAVDPDFKVFASSYPFVLQKLLTDNSAPLRRILTPLILDKKKHFRWDRLASFAAIAQQHALKRVALERGMELRSVSVTDLRAKGVDPELLQLLVNLLLSEKGLVFRQLILEADTFDLVRIFNSSKAAALRKNVATAMASVLYEQGKHSLKRHLNINVQDPSQPRIKQSAAHAEWSQEASMVSEKSLTDDVKALTNCSEALDISLLRSKQMQWLLEVALTRLRTRPLLLMRTGWTIFTMMCYAIALAGHKLVVALNSKVSKSHLESSSKPGYQLATA